MNGVGVFPWQRVPRLERGAVEARRELSKRLGGLDLSQLGTALRQLLGDAELVSVQLEQRRRGQLATVAPFDAHTLQFPGLGIRLTLWPEPELARACVARLLGQGFELGWADAGIDAALRGASAALALEVARRAARAEAPVLVVADLPADDGWISAGHATLRLDGKPYRIELCAEALALGRPALVVKRPAELLRLGSTSLRVPWVAALSTATVAELESLQVGDVWVPGRDAWVGGDTTLAAGLLAAPGSERGLSIRMSAGRIVLGAEAVPVHEEPTTMSQEDSDLTQIVGETPLVVRLELGSVEMSAAEWAALRPGDVVQCGRRIEEPVVLRAAGREIARGELVDIEGEIGVRITQVGVAVAVATASGSGSSGSGSSGSGSGSSGSGSSGSGSSGSGGGGAAGNGAGGAGPVVP